VERKTALKTTNFMRRTVVLIALCLLPSFAANAAEDLAVLFPELDGWIKDGAPEFYAPEDLFEYINGAADLYLSFDFEQLATLSYEGGGKRSLSVDVYRHADLRNAFGIYSQEKPRTGEFLPIGTQGYYDKGTLNFFHGRHYVKIMGFSLGDEDEKILTEVATEIACRLVGEPAFPKALECFPDEGKIAGSERFLARDVLGHGFLHAAYSADYEIDGSEVRLFLIEGDDEGDANRMFEKYLEIARSGGPVVEDGATRRFIDPRRASAETFNLRKAGKYLWGLSANDEKAADRLLDAVEKNLGAHGFVE
jgi:hypothetical protein